MKLACLVLTGFLTFGYAAEQRNSFYLGGALVHSVKPEKRRHDSAVIMIPGLNLSSAIFLHTPDGRTGWAQHFARKGYDVYVINDPRFDFSRGFSVEGFRDVPTEGAPKADPSARQGWGQDVWRRWGFGSSAGNPYPNGRFPTKYFAKFEADYPYLSNSRSSYAEAISSLLEKIGPAVLMPHSMAGPQAVRAALEKPKLVKGFVLLEPTGAPSTTDFPTFANKFMLGIYGDYIDSRRQSGRKAGVEAAAQLFSKNGGPAEVISLPDSLQIKGNTHLMMQDNNSEQIAELIIKWLADPRDNPPSGENLAAASSGRGRGRGGRGGRGRGLSATIFTQLDADGNKLITPIELGKSRRYSQSDSAALKQAVESADSNGDGFLDLKEFEKVVAGGRGGRSRRGGRDGN